MTIKYPQKQRLKRELINYLGIIFASVFFAAGYSWFLLPYNMAPGGVGGISQIIYAFTGLPNGVSMILINLPLFVISFIFIGKSFGSKSLYGMFVSGIMTDLLSFRVMHKIGIIKDLAPYTHIVEGKEILALLPPQEIFLSAIAGSVLLGLGLGLIFRFRGSTGGTDIPVALIRQKANLSIGTSYYIVETGIILAVAIFLGDP
jgi:uncharacterized membrane-anchored protein YitT (DUF2179 family)